jgi:DNA-binding SARP family transcriptional activator/predicted ATPase
MSSTLDIRLLGSFDLELDGIQQTGVHASRLQSLLAYLLLQGKAFHSRSHLAFLFWPDLTETQARNNLRQAVHQLRHALPESDRFLYADASTLRWRWDAPFHLDVVDFEETLAATDLAKQKHDTDAQRDALERALRQYRGDLLPSCYDDWIVPERERLHQKCLRAFEELIHLLEAQRDYDTAISYAQRLTQHDRLHEDGYRLLMRLQALNGDRASALRTYHACADTLQRELDVEPEATTRDLYQRLLHAEGEAEVTKQMPSAMTPAPLVGRTRSWAKLLATWQRAAAGGPHFVLLTGEAGIGKSRLAEDLFEWAARQGISTAKARVYEAEGRLSYGPLADWLRSPACRIALPRLEKVWLTEIARLLPELLEKSPDLQRPEPLTEQWQRQRFHQALARAMLGTRQPVLLMLDDLQWCDPETLEWLHFLLRADPKARLLLVGTARAEEIIANPALETLLVALRSTAQITEIPLERLDAAETAQLAGHLAGLGLDVDTALRLFTETEGNPLFVLETVRSGSLAGEPRSETPAGDEYQPSAAGTAAEGLPPKVQAVIAARLAQLTAPAHELASLAAAIGRAFTFEVLAQASVAAEDDLVRWLDELWQRRIIRALNESQYDFTHDKLREVAYSEMSPPRKRLVHRRVAHALETIFAADLDLVSGQLAAHYERAGLPWQATPYFHRAAVVAQRVSANDEAVSLLDKGLALLRGLRESPDRDVRELELQTALGVSLVDIRGHGAPEVIAVYARAQELCLRLGQPSSPPILRALALAHVARAEFRQALGYGEQLLRLADTQASSVLAVEAHYVLGTAGFWLGEFEPARNHLARAVAVYNPQQSRTHISLYSQDPKALCLSRLAFDLWCLGYPDQAVTINFEALAHARETEHSFSLAYAMFWSAMLRNDLRAFAVGREQTDALLAFCGEHRLPYWLHSRVLQGWAQAECGDIKAGIALIRDGMEDFRAMGAEFQRPFFLSLLAEQSGRAGEVTEGLEFLDEALVLVERSGERWCEAEAYRRRGSLLAQRGDHADAVVAFQHALAIARHQQAKMLELRAAIPLARLWLKQRNVIDAHRLLAPICDWFREGFDTPDLQDAQVLLRAMESSRRGDSKKE